MQQKYWDHGRSTLVSTSTRPIPNSFNCSLPGGNDMKASISPFLKSSIASFLEAEMYSKSFSGSSPTYATNDLKKTIGPASRFVQAHTFFPFKSRTDLILF